jgi:hypothetical protein
MRCACVRAHHTCEAESCVCCVVCARAGNWTGRRSCRSEQATVPPRRPLPPASPGTVTLPLHAGTGALALALASASNRLLSIDKRVVCQPYVVHVLYDSATSRGHRRWPSSALYCTTRCVLLTNLHSLNFATPVSSMQHRFRALRHFPSKDDRTLHRAALEKPPRMHERPRHSRAAGLCTRRLPVEPKAAPVARAGVIPGRATMASGDQSIRAGGGPPRRSEMPVRIINMGS